MGKWICHPGDNRLTKLVPVFRRIFEVDKTLEKALLHLTAHGVYEAEINGRRVTENKFMPGLTSYYYRIQVQEYDIADLLHQGPDPIDFVGRIFGRLIDRFQHEQDPLFPVSGPCYFTEGLIVSVLVL